MSHSQPTDDAVTDAVLTFWFGDAVHASDPALERHVVRWFQATETLDREIARTFGPTIKRALAGELDPLAATPNGRLALIVVLDQFTRNAFRDTPNAFSGDTKAQALCREGLHRLVDPHLEPVHRHFFYLPLLHAEDPADQELSVGCFERLADGAPPHQYEHFAACANAARRYRDIIFRFGRFPHRNRIVGRESSDDERRFLAETGVTAA